MNVIIKKGKIFGKGVFANKDFKKGEIVIKYHLKHLTKSEHESLSKIEKEFCHVHWGKFYLYSVPERYVNHSIKPNTKQDLKQNCDVAIKAIKKGEAITTNATKDDVF